jgi:hypothetical protein
VFFDCKSLQTNLLIKQSLLFYNVKDNRPAAKNWLKEVFSLLFFPMSKCYVFYVSSLPKVTVWYAVNVEVYLSSPYFWWIR